MYNAVFISSLNSLWLDSSSIPSATECGLLGSLQSVYSISSLELNTAPWHSYVAGKGHLLVL